MEMGMQRLSSLEEEIESIRQNQSMLDFCENVCIRNVETKLCLHRLSRLNEKVKRLE